MIRTLRFVPVALAALVVASTLVAGVASPAAATQESASFHAEDGVVSVTRGDTASITVSHSARATLTIGSQSAGFEVRIPLGGSGTKTVEFDTSATTASSPDAFLSVGGATLETRPLDGAIDPGQYTMRITIDGVEQAYANLYVRERGDTTGTPAVAPGDVALDDAKPGEVYDRVTRQDVVAHGDYAVFAVNESGLSYAFGESPTPTSLADAGLDASVVELDPAPNTAADEYDGDDLHVVSQVAAEDRFLVLWDTSQTDLQAGSNHTYEFRLTMDGGDSALVSEDRRLVTNRVQVVEPRVDVRADPGFTLLPWQGTTVQVTGTTNLAPTTELDVRALQQSPRAYLWKHVESVTANGTFAATFDFASAARPNAFPLWVRGYRDVSERTVELATGEASLAFADQRVDGGAVTVRNVSLSHAGFVRVAANGTTLGASAHLDAGEYESVAVPLNGTIDSGTNATAVAVADANRNGTLDDGDVPYQVNGTVVSDGAFLVPARDETATTDAQPTTDTGPATTTATTLRAQEGDPITPVQAGGGSSGFVPLSPLAVVVALAAAALLGWRQ